MSQVVRVLPSKGGDPKVRLPLDTPTPDIDTPVWRAAVDPAEARRPLALPVEQRPTEVSHFMLPNGLRVVLAGNFTQPVVEARLVFPVGGTSADAGDNTIAHAAARLLTHDLAHKYSAVDRSTVAWVLGLGAQLSAEVTDHTTFRIRGSAAFADWHLWRLSWLLQEGIYADDELRRVRVAVVRSQRGAAQRQDSQGWRHAMREALFGHDHPYTLEPDVAADVAALSIAELEQFRETYYRASGATLIIAGNFDPAATRRTVVELFGAWPTQQPPPRQLPAIPAMHPVPGPTWIAHGDPGATQVRITLGFVATSQRIRSRAARAVVAEMIRSRLDLVRTQMSASYGIEAGYDLTPAGDVFQVDGRVDAGRAGDVIRRMVAELGNLRTGGDAFAGDFVRARRAVLAVTLADPGRASATARRLENAVANHLALDDGASLPAAVAATTLVDVYQVIAEDLQPARMVGVLSGQPADTAAALTAAGITGVRTL